ncbi:LAGLIDADG family homing endonuclease [Patescibacteria group bacterium]|nr:LAGLIDADG family homing endonuclease [Patescibacteria group bacterium]
MNWSYIAGFFDGEGSVAHNGKGFRITIAQTDLEILNLIKDFTGVGHVIEVTKRKKHWKDAWVYYIAKQKDVYYFLQTVHKHVYVKRGVIEETLPKLKQIVQDIDYRKTRRERLIKEVKNLRSQGLTYRAIGKKLKIDFGQARRLYLQDK